MKKSAFKPENRKFSGSCILFKSSIKKLFTKAVSLSLVLSFLSSQILWAEPAAKDYTANQFSEQPFGVSPTDLTGRQDAVQSVVDNDNFLQNFNNTQPLVVNAPLSDGTIKPFNLTDIYATSFLAPDGTQYLYDANGQLAQTVSPSGSVTNYSRPAGPSGGVVVENDKYRLVSDAAGQIQES